MYGLKPIPSRAIIRVRRQPVKSSPETSLEFESGGFFADLPLDGVLDQFAAAAEGEFLLDVGLVGLHGLYAEVEFLGDLPGGTAFPDQAKDF